MKSLLMFFLFSFSTLAENFNFVQQADQAVEQVHADIIGSSLLKNLNEGNNSDLLKKQLSRYRDCRAICGRGVAKALAGLAAKLKPVSHRLLITRLSSDRRKESSTPTDGRCQPCEDYGNFLSVAVANSAVAGLVALEPGFRLEGGVSKWLAANKPNRKNQLKEWSDWLSKDLIQSDAGEMRGLLESYIKDETPAKQEGWLESYRKSLEYPGRVLSFVMDGMSP